jgi:uncharacterized alkaline shock family protein YloU
VTAREDRGRLEVDPAVVRKVARRAADHAPATLRTPRGTTVRVSGHGADVNLSVELALRYPVAVREAVAEVRDRVRGDVERITGYRVRGVDVTVAALLPESRSRVE